MDIKVRLKAMLFLQYFIWGAWLITLGSYMMATLKFTGADVGWIYSTKGLAAVIMPGLVGIIADKFIPANRLYGLCHLICAGALFYAATVTDVNAAECDGLYADHCPVKLRQLRKPAKI